MPTLRSTAFRAPTVLLIACAAIPSAAHAQQATLLGTVLADSTERPLMNAEVSIPSLSLSVRTDSAGNFAIARVTAGRYAVVVRAVGHVPQTETVTFGATDRIERDYYLKRAVTTLAEVEVKAKTTALEPRLAEFEARRKLGLGKFITQDVLEKAEGRKLADVLRTWVPGLRAIPVGSGNAMASTRGGGGRLPSGDRVDRMQGATPQCYVQVIVDGLALYRSQPGEKLFDLNTIMPTQLAGVEYHSTSTTPMQFNSMGAPCGTLILWTRIRY
jgi:hypothetical protein